MYAHSRQVFELADKQASEVTWRERARGEKERARQADIPSSSSISSSTSGSSLSSFSICHLRHIATF
jgi:hypothetical protein